MKSSVRRQAEKASIPQEAVPSDRIKRPKRWMQAVAISAIALGAIVLVSASANLFMERRERSRITPYGKRVQVAGGSMNVWRSGRPGPTIVLLSGLGTSAPALDFAPLVRELDDYDVVVVEGFGYGYSDMKARPRTVENITSELHEVLSKIEVDEPFILAGHSISGFYTLSYASRYPEEVSAVIGIDPTVPAANASADEPGGGINWGRGLAAAGIARGAILLFPSLAEPAGASHTADELARMRRMAIWNYGNPAVADETARIASNAASLRGVSYPESLPVLDLLASDSVSTIPGWVEKHEDQLRNVQRHEVVVLDGGHYLHWTQSRAMAEKITDFLQRD